MPSVLPSFRPDFRLIFPLATLAALSPTVSAADLSFRPASLDFGNLALTESKTVKAIFTNATALPVNIVGTAFAGTNAADYSLTHTCPAPVPAGQSCAFLVTFKPAALTASAATLTVATDDPALPAVNLPLAGNRYPGALNDTGITQCGDASQNGLPCPVTGFPRQDAETGRDANPKLNTDANGHAGFNFTKLDANGNPLKANARKWNCVRDNVTGLVWEVKSKPDGVVGNQGLHDSDDTYTWYSTDSANNNGSVGYRNESTKTCYRYLAGREWSYCNTEAYVNRVNEQGWCGAKDWRMPAHKELRGLVDLGVPYPGPTIDARYFPDSNPRPWYWSSSPDANKAYLAWIVGFDYDYSNNLNYGRNLNFAVRLVRGGQ